MKKNKILAILIVAIVIVGLVMAYVPLLFYRAPSGSAPPPTASLTPPQLLVSTSSEEQPKTETPTDLDSLIDLGDEQKNLEDLNKLLDAKD